jgi:glutaredoxin
MDFMKSRGVDYEVIDLMENKDAQKFIFTKVGQYAVPIIEVGDKFMVGYNQVELEKLINSLQK